MSALIVLFLQLCVNKLLMLTTFLPYDLNCLVFTHFYGSTRTLNEMMESDNLAFANLYYLHSIKEFSRLAYLSFCRFVHLFLHFCDCLTWPNRCFYHTQKNRSEVDVLYSSFMDSLILYAHTKKNRQLNSVCQCTSFHPKKNKPFDVYK